MELHFSVYAKESLRSDHPKSVRTPQAYPSFSLVMNDGWNDYQWFTWFTLWFHKDEDHKKIRIGDVKILHFEEQDTLSQIPGSFSEPLPATFCSLGIDTDYYVNLREILGEDPAFQVCKYLRDVAVDSLIYEEVCNWSGYRVSLERDFNSEKARREGKLILSGKDRNSFYSFNFRIKLEFYDSPVTLQVPFEYKPKDYKRWIGIIGENGVGKTNLLKGFAECLVKKDAGGFDSLPNFSFVSYIASTSFDLPSVDAPEDAFPHVFINLREGENFANIRDCLSTISTKGTIDGKSLIYRYKECLDSLFPKFSGSIFDEDYIENMAFSLQEDEKSISINIDAVEEIFYSLSSGERHIFTMVTFLFANLHFSSLIILDEPELHLHPSIILDFMTALSNVLGLFRSYAIIATHSPLIIREMPSDRVHIMMRDEDNVPSLNFAPFDTFGENISTLYEEIFNYNQNRSLFSILVRERLEQGKTTEEIAGEFKSSKSMVNYNALSRIHELANQHAQSNQTD